MNHIFPFEMDALLDALRRDMRVELNKAISDVWCADLHLRNARRNVSLLEALNPRYPGRAQKRVAAHATVVRLDEHL